MAGFLALACVGAWLGFANPFTHLPVLVLLLPLGVAGVGLRAGRPGRAFRLGWLTGTLAYAGALYWVALPVHDYGYLPWALAGPCPVALGAWCGLFTGLFALCMHAGRGMSPASRALLAATAWASLEALRAWLFTGFPWVPLASAFSPWTFAVQGAALAGAEGLSGLYAGLAVLALPRSWSGGRLAVRPVLASMVLLAAVWAAGLAVLRTDVPAQATAMVGIVQGNVDQSLKWDQSFQEGTVDRYLDMSGELARRAAPELVVWPETSMPFYLQEPGLLTSRVRTLARTNAMAVIAGAPAYRFDNGDTALLTNRAYLVGPDGEFAGSYDKAHLVPFGEYVPLQRFLPFLDKLVQAAGDFVPGEDASPLRTGDIAAGMLVCYETIFPSLAQERVSLGANLLVNISNDAWFGRSSAPVQHLDMSVLRAVEQGRWLVRSTNTGISAVIGPRGRVLATSDLFRAQVLSARVGLVSSLTPYHRIRPWLLWALAAATALLAAPGLLRRKDRLF